MAIRCGGKCWPTMANKKILLVARQLKQLNVLPGVYITLQADVVVAEMALVHKLVFTSYGLMNYLRIILCFVLSSCMLNYPLEKRKSDL